MKKSTLAWIVLTAGLIGGGSWIGLALRADAEQALALAARSRYRAEELAKALADAKEQAMQGDETLRKAMKALVARLDEGLEFLDEQQSRLEQTTQTKILRLRDELMVKIGSVREEVAGRSKAAEASTPPETLKDRLAAEGVRIEPEAGRVSVSGRVIQRNVLVEFVAVTTRGKTHESLFLVDCEPHALNAGLLALGLQPGTPFQVKEEAEVPEADRAGITTFEWEDHETEETKTLYYFPPSGDGVRVFVSWTLDGTEHRHRIEELIMDSTTDAPLPPMDWVYLGSRLEYDPDAGKEIYIADYTGDVISIWHSYRGNTILDNPLVAGRNDELYFANTSLLPEEGTVVTLIFERVAGEPGD